MERGKRRKPFIRRNGRREDKEALHIKAWNEEREGSTGYEGMEGKLREGSPFCAVH
jgi:hypothetical protein